MRITALQIERFGVWEQLSIPLSGRGLSVFYGPNEAGKTTLFRFLRSMLYGFDPFGVELRDGTSRPIRFAGTLRVDAIGRQFEIRRVSDRGTRGVVSVAGTDRQEPAETLLAGLLHGTDEALFENVFAVGLPELQVMATLAGDEVAHHIYGLTLGPTGRKLLDATAVLELARGTYFEGPSRSGRLVDLLEREQSLRDDLAAHPSLREEHAELSVKRSQIENRIESLKHKQVDCQRQLGGHRMLERVWPHWSQVRDLRREIAAIPTVSGFPADGPARLQKLETELDAAKHHRADLTQSLQSLRAKLQDLARQRKLQRNGGVLAGFVEQSGWYRDVSQQAAVAGRRADEHRAELDWLLEPLGAEWTLARVDGLDAGPVAHRRILAAAGRYRSAIRRRKRLLGLQKRLRRATHKRRAELDERLKGLGGTSLEDTIAQQTRRIKDLGDLGRLRLHEADLSHRRNRLAEQLQPKETGAEHPQWVSHFLALLLGAGLLVTIVGLFQAALSDVLAGASLIFIGLTGLGVGWGLKRHEQQMNGAASGNQEELGRIEFELREARAAIARQSASPSPAAVATSENNSPLQTADSPPSEPGVPEGDLLRTAVSRLAELERWNQTRRAIQARRRRLSELRSRFQAVQRDVSSERQNWCTLLKEVGLPETVKIDAALQAWHRLVEARERVRAVKAAEAERQQLEGWLHSFRTRMDDAGRRAGRPPADDKPPLDVLAEWDAELQSSGAVRDEYRRTRHEFRERRRKREQVRRRIGDLRARRTALFAKGGATDRKEFLARAAWAARRQECEELLEIANEELLEASRSEPELAIVEDDLESYEPDRNRQRIESLAAELDQAERDLHAAFEDLGSVKQSLKALEADRETSRLRFAQSQTRYELKQAAEAWFGTELARQAVDRVRSKFERTCQPATLALASKYLARLTRGRYVNVWIPLGRRELRVDDDRGNTLSVEQLSGGTREQLFLAVRMATVRELAQQGIELPMIFDDVLVNFDQIRTEAAVDALLDFAAENQQILFFTCHLHLAHLFESRGVEPTWLPGHNLPQAERRAG